MYTPESVLQRTFKHPLSQALCDAALRFCGIYLRLRAKVMGSNPGVHINVG